MTQIDFLAIGDITTDAFINIHENSRNCKIDIENQKLCFDFGSKIPYDSVDIVRATGNSANASVTASRLGLKSALLSYVGDDKNGAECIEELNNNKVNTKFVRIENNKKTNYHYILWYDVDRTILTKHESFSYYLGEIEKPRWIYLSSLPENSLEFHNQIVDFLEKNPKTKLAFSPGTFEIKMGKDNLEKIYKNTEIFFCNVEEAKKITGIASNEISLLLKSISKLGPKITVITDGIKGAYCFNGDNIWSIPVYPGGAFERTGAGDAFASTVVSGLSLGKTLEEALLWGPINSMSVVMYVGAQKGLLSENKIKEYLDKAPENYKLEKLTTN